MDQAHGPALEAIRVGSLVGQSTSSPEMEKLYR